MNGRQKDIEKERERREREREREAERDAHLDNQWYTVYVIVCHVCIENRGEQFVSDKLVNVPRQ